MGVWTILKTNCRKGDNVIVNLDLVIQVLTFQSARLYKECCLNKSVYSAHNEYITHHTWMAF